jgi:DNA-binding MarR family transcriptional regulator
MSDTAASLPGTRQARPRSPAQEAKVAILRTADLLRRRITEVVAPFGLTAQQYNVLRILRGAHPGKLPTLEIGDRMIETTPGITRLLDRLEEKGWVQRKRGSEDRRLVLCWITDAGLSLLAQLDEAMDEADRRSLGWLERDEVRRLVEQLERIQATP